jgi:hypothetical protein
MGARDSHRTGSARIGQSLGVSPKNGFKELAAEQQERSHYAPAAQQQEYSHYATHLSHLRSFSRRARRSSMLTSSCVFHIMFAGEP